MVMLFFKVYWVFDEFWVFFIFVFLGKFYIILGCPMLVTLFYILIRLYIYAFCEPHAGPATQDVLDLIINPPPQCKQMAVCKKTSRPRPSPSRPGPRPSFRRQQKGCFFLENQNFRCARYHFRYLFCWFAVSQIPDHIVCFAGLP